LLKLNSDTIFTDSSFADLKPSAYNSVSEIKMESGILIATGLNNIFKLSGSVDLAP
jgi:hypothetical protein